MPGNYLLSHTGPRAVPSAMRSLTSLFEMGRGVTSAVMLPSKFLYNFYIFTYIIKRAEGRRYISSILHN